VKKTSPGFTPDLYTLFGWLSAELFTQALQQAEAHPSRGSVLQALRGINSFDGGHITSTADPAKKIPSNCYIIAQVQNGQFVRLDDPPVAPPAYGYPCDQPHFNYSGG
jgi:ABC-type branched-subunit amino acid transport system substrate-binding protein